MVSRQRVRRENAGPHRLFFASLPHSTATGDRDRQRGSSWHKEGRLAAQGDSFLHDLIQHEQKQSERVAAARSEADAIVAAAQQEAAEVLERSRRAADGATAAAAEAARSEAEATTAKVVGAAEAESDRLRSAADARRERAVQMVLEQVLP
jgi:vacuolar-type H+-ATPase subunit H